MNNLAEIQPPNWIGYLFRVAAIVALGAVVLAVFRGWKLEQAHHADMISDITVNLGGRPVREHCNTCHAYLGASMSARPRAGHPDIAPHSMEKLGCTGCHLGEGMAFDPELSHGLPGYGARKVLKGEELQASCYKCHDLTPLEGAEQAWEGYQIFSSRPCGTCHRINMLRGGGYSGPDLSDIGSYLGLEKLFEAIRDPKKEPVNSIMPRFPLSRPQVTRITYFLKSRVKEPFHLTPMILESTHLAPHTLEPSGFGGSEDREMGLLRTLRCTGCHKFEEEDGQVSPDLTFIGRMRTQAYLDQFISSPTKLIPGAVMPIIPMDAKVKDSLIRSLFTHGAKDPGHSGHNDPKSLYMDLCQRCHAATGDGFGIIQPNLANFPRAFANNAAFFRSLSDEHIQTSMSVGIPGTSMPPYGQLLAEPERNSLIDLTFSAFIGINRYQKDMLSPLPEKPSQRLQRAHGERLFKENCASCHGRAGTGTGPEYLKYLPRPRNLQNSLFFAPISDERIGRSIHDGVSGTAMPAFNKRLDADGLWGLVQEVRRFSGTGGTS